MGSWQVAGVSVAAVVVFVLFLWCLWRYMEGKWWWE